MGDWQIVRRALEVAGSVWPTSESEDGEYCNEASQLLAFNLVLDHLKPAQ